MKHLTTNPLSLPAISPSSVSIAGLYMTVFACAIALTLASNDQSGATLSRVSAAFRRDTHSPQAVPQDVTRRLRSDRILTTAVFVWPPKRSPDAENFALQQQQANPGSKTGTESSEESPNKPTIQPGDEPVGESIGINGVFSNLVNELRRHCDVSPIQRIENEIAVDLLPNVPVADSELTRRLVEMIRQTRSAAENSGYDYEIVCWATSPNRAAFVDAAKRASTVAAAVVSQSEGLELNNHVLSCGQIWTSKTAMRPAASLVIRRWN